MIKENLTNHQSNRVDFQAPTSPKIQAHRLLPLSRSPPSFSSYSNVNLVEIAARVIDELRIEEDDTQCDCVLLKDLNNLADNHEEEDNDEKDEDEFDFAFVCREPEFSPVSADEIFQNGRIKTIYPYNFKPNEDSRNQVLNNRKSETDKTREPSVPSIRSPLRKLFGEEMTWSSSCSSSEADELDAVSPETYCVWTPQGANIDRHNLESSSARITEKTDSTESSKRWRLRHILRRSNSDVKDRFFFLEPSKKKMEVSLEGGGAKKKKTAEKAVGKEAKQVYYMKNGKGRRVKEGDVKRRTYVPYKQELVGGFSNVRGLSRVLRPF